FDRLPTFDATVANDACSGATQASGLPFHDVVDTTAASTGVADPPLSCSACYGGRGAGSVWYLLDAPADGQLTVGVQGPAQAAVALRSPDCVTPSELACHTTGPVAAHFKIAAGQRYAIEVAGAGCTDVGRLGIDLGFEPPCHADADCVHAPGCTET